MQQRFTNELRWEPTDWQCVSLIGLLVGIYYQQILLGNAFLWEDFLFQWYPFRQFAASTMAGGEVPLWNPYTFNGMPFLADVQTQIFYLPLTALALVVRDGHLPVLWLEVVNIVHYVIAGAGMFYLAKSFHMRQIPAVLAGVVYSLSGFMVAHAIHQVIITLVCWYPWILLLFRKALGDTRWLWVFVASIVLGHSFFAGFPQLSLFLYFFLAVFFVFELLTTVGVRGVFTRPALVMCAKAVCIVVLSLGLIMIQLLPTTELSRLSVRAQITYEKATEGSLSWSQLLTLFVPKFLGVSYASGYDYWGPGTYWYYWETCIYLGILPLFLMILSVFLLKKNRYVAFFLGFCVFAVLFAFGGNFIVQKLFFYYIPGFSTFRNPSRMSVFLAFGAALLSGFALQHLLYDQRTTHKDRILKRVLYASVGIGIIMLLLILSGSLSSVFPFLQQEPKSTFVRREAFVSAAFLLVSGGLLLWVLMKNPRPWIAGAVGIVVLFIDLIIFGGSQNTSPMNPEEYFKRAEPIVRFLKSENEIFRVNTRNNDGLLMDRNQGMMDRIFTTEGYTPFVLQRVYPPVRSGDQMYDLLNVKYVTVTDRENRRLTLQPHRTYLPRAFMLYAVHVVTTEQELLAYLKSAEFNHHTTAVLEKDPGVSLPSGSTVPEWSARIVGYTNNSIMLNVETSHNGILVVSEVYYPGWKAFIDGKETEIYRADYNLRGICLPEGEHIIDMRFEPESYGRGRMITLGTLIVCIAGIVVSKVRARRASVTETTL